MHRDFFSNGFDIYCKYNALYYTYMFRISFVDYSQNEKQDSIILRYNKLTNTDDIRALCDILK